METTVWIVAGLLLLAGFIGSIVPLLPGTTLMLAAVLLQKWLLPETLSWTVVSWIAAFWAVSLFCDFACTLFSTRVFGGTKWGLAGASGGAFVGMFFSVPAILLGTVLGAAAAEMWGAKRSAAESLKAGAGAAVGFLLGTVTRFACATVILALYAISAYAVLKARLPAH